MTGWEEKRRPAPTPVFARCSALSGVEFGSCAYQKVSLPANPRIPTP
jgi:hypothetical protein